MRYWLGLLIVIMLVSHGGFSGAIAHAEQVHSHETGSPHHAPVPVEETLGVNSVKAEISAPGEMAPHGAAHSHVAVGLPESASPFASRLSERLLPHPGEMAALVGSEAAPLTEPPLA